MDMNANVNMNMHERAFVHLQRRIPASPDRVYRAWLDPAQLRRWLAPGNVVVTRVEVDEQVGGRFRIWQSTVDEATGDEETGGFECELLELAPAERIVFRWTFVGPNRLDGPAYETRLTIDLEGEPDGSTELTLVHERLEKLHAAMPDVASAIELSWETVLDKLSVVAVR